MCMIGAITTTNKAFGEPPSWSAACRIPEGILPLGKSVKLISKAKKSTDTFKILITTYI